MDVICNMALTSWAKLNAVIAILTEKQLYEMLAHEQLTRQRLDIMVRIQQRLNALEGEKRIAELEGEVRKMKPSDKEETKKSVKVGSLYGVNRPEKYERRDPWPNVPFVAPDFPTMPPVIFWVIIAIGFVVGLTWSMW